MLNGKQKRHLRSMGNGLEPTLHVGKEGFTEALVRELDAALEAHELVKVRVLSTAGLERDALGEDLAAATGSDLAQVLGWTLLLFRASVQRPVIELPK